MTIEDFLQTLEERDLVAKSIIKQVRDKVVKGDRRITPKSLLKYLVKKELVTRTQAKQLLETTLTVSPNAESSILGMAMTPRAPQISPPPPSINEDVPTLAPIDNDSEKQQEDAGSSGLVTDEGSMIGRVDVFGEKPSSLVSESISKIGLGDTTLTEEIQESEPDVDGLVKQREKRKKKVKKNEWDSSLLLLGGGGLMLLFLIGGIIGYLLLREDADAILAEGNKFFDGGSYTQAIHQYERFVENHPKHPEYSAVKVRLGMAKLWRATSGTDYVEALSTAQGVLKDIEDEEEFPSAQRDLASLLPKIAQGLANHAEKTAESNKILELVQQTNAALSMCANTRYIPTAFRDEVLMDEIDQTLQRVERSRAQRTALTAALAEMQTAVTANDTVKAYQIHDQLLDEFPGLINDEQLSAKVLEISNAEAAVVRFVEESQEAETLPRASNTVAEITLAKTSGSAASGSDGVVAVRVDGAVYGINLRDGAVRWRQFVGVAPELAPLHLPSGDVLVVDDRNHELLSLAGDSGDLRWRLAFESKVSSPVVLEDQILIAETEGKLHVIDSQSGKRSGYVQFAQQLTTPPTVDLQLNRIYIAGEHSSLYSLSAKDFSCLGVFFLSHAKGSIVAPPAVVLNKVVIAVAKGLSTTQLEVISTNADGIANNRAASRRLDGLVSTNLLTEGRRLVALTNTGQINVFEFSAGEGNESVTEIASRDSESGDPVARFGLLSEGYVWVAGNQLQKLRILPTSDRLSVSTIDRDYPGDTFDHTLQVQGDLLVHVRRPNGQAGVRIGAISIDAGRSQWETELAVPLAGSPAVDPDKSRLAAVSSGGSSYLIDREAMRRRVLNQEEQFSARRKIEPLTENIDMGGGRVVASAVGSDKIVYFRPEELREAVKTITLAGPASCSPTIWGDGFVVPTNTGQVYFWSAEDGSQLGSPFQPPLAPGVTYEWRQPAAYGDSSDSALLISDGQQKVYLLKRETKPEPHLSAIASVDLKSSPLNTGFAIVSNLAVAGSKDGSLSVFSLPDLSTKQSVNLGAQVVWGPFSIGNNFVLATATDELIGFDEQATIVWRRSLARGPLVGKPLTQTDGFMVACQTGGLSRIQLNDGSESAFIPLEQPTVSDPVAFGNRLIVSTHDGTLLVIERP